MKYLILFAFLIVSCSSPKQIITYNIPIKEICMRDTLNSAIIDGFFNGDTSNLPEDVYFVK